MIQKLVICLNYGYFEIKLRSVIVSQSHYLNQILDVHPLYKRVSYNVVLQEGQSSSTGPQQQCSDAGDI